MILRFGNHYWTLSQLLAGWLAYLNYNLIIKLIKTQLYHQHTGHGARAALKYLKSNCQCKLYNYIVYLHVYHVRDLRASWRLPWQGEDTLNLICIL